MKKSFKVLSLFDGISCVQIALHAVGIRNYIIYSSEINGKAMRVTQYHFPDTYQVGDVVELNPYDFRDIDLIVGGSPCQSMSRMGLGNGITTKSGIVIYGLTQYMTLKEEWRKTTLKYEEFFNESALYWEWMRMLKGIQHYNPDVLYLLENVRAPYWEAIITLTMGVEPYKINSADVCAQNRERNYWTNIPLTKIVKRNVKIGDVIPGAVNGAGKRGKKPRKNEVVNIKLSKKGYFFPITVRTDNKANCLVTCQKPTGYYVDKRKNLYLITPEHAEALQTLPIGYTGLPGISDSARFEMIGNAWTVEVIKYFLENVPAALKSKAKHKVKISKL